MARFKAKQMGYINGRLVQEGDLFDSETDVPWATLVSGDVAEPEKAAVAAPAGSSLADMQAGKAGTLAKELEATQAELAAHRQKDIQQVRDIAVLENKLAEAEKNAVEPTDVKKLKADLKAAQTKVDEQKTEIADLTKANEDWKVAYDDLKKDVDEAADNKPPNEPG